jgi:hypothetical protein
MELTALVIVSVELIMKFRWVGFKIFIHHPRSMVKVGLFCKNKLSISNFIQKTYFKGSDTLDNDS